MESKEEQRYFNAVLTLIHAILTLIHAILTLFNAAQEQRYAIRGHAIPRIQVLFLRRFYTILTLF